MSEKEKEVELAQKKRLRGGARTQLTRLLGKVNPLIDADGVGQDTKCLKQFILQIEEYVERLKTLDTDILELISAFDDSEDLCAKDMDESEHYREKANMTVLSLEEILEHRKRPTATMTIRSSPLRRSESRETLDSGRKTRAKLPKLEPKKFNGKADQWQEFWDSFESSVHGNEELSKVDKFSYLKYLVQEPARAVISGFKLTEENYESAVRLLHERYAKPVAIKRAHIHELENTSPVYNERNIARLRAFYDHIETHVRGMEAMGIHEETYSTTVVPGLMAKLPAGFRLNMIRGATGYERHEEWRMRQFIEAFKKELEIREVYEPVLKPGEKQQTDGPKQNNTMKTATALYTGGDGREPRCAYCNGNHREDSCSKVTDLNERKNILRKYGRCFLCLKKRHRIAECRSNQSCRSCNGNHHTTICSKVLGNPQAAQDSPTVHVSLAPTAPPVSQCSRVGTVGTSDRVALQTAQAIVENGEESMRVRVLFDSGSHRSFVTSSLVSRLNLEPVISESIGIKPFGTNVPETKVRNIVELSLMPISSNARESVKLQAIVVDEIAEIPNVHTEIIKNDFKHLSGIWFSDVCTTRQTLPVNILIGSDQLWNFQKDSTIRGGSDEPVAVETRLGWVLSGPIKGKKVDLTETLNVNFVIDSTAEKNIPVEHIVDKLWDLDSIGIREGNEIHEDIVDNITFDGTRYCTKLPWKTNHNPVPSNYDCSLSRLKSQLRKLKNEPEIMEEYNNIIQQQLKDGVIETVNGLEPAKKISYLPHMAVVRKDAETTKVRVVFDASCKERKSGTSLNDCLHVGPPLTPLLFDILVRFRENRIAIVGDIEKAFLNIEVDPSDRDVLRFLWVDDIYSDNPSIVEYRYKRVVFGVRSSPFLLNAVLRHHINSFKDVDPVFVSQLCQNFYVDDLVSGAGDKDQVLQLYRDAKARLLEGGFKLRKWKTNDPELQKQINKLETTEDVSFCEEQSFAKETLGSEEKKGTAKVLGVDWSCKSDNLEFSLDRILNGGLETKMTKRNLLSAIARLFDPLGLLSPIVLTAKAIFQQLCVDNVGWDDDLSETVLSRLKAWIKQVKGCNHIEIPRCLYAPDTGKVLKCYLHGFGDASQTAYCASIYLVYQTETGWYSQLICAKTRVAPLKSHGIPRLELLSARILASLMKTVHDAISSQVQIDGIHFWLDSKTALFWILNQGEWKQFVRHRVNEILSNSNKSDWGHCAGQENPADIGSRGASPILLKHSALWWNGPRWLTRGKEYWPESIVLSDTEEVRSEAKKIVTANTVIFEDSPLIDIERYSSLHRLRRVMAWIQRFKKNMIAKIKKEELNLAPDLSVQEISEAEILLIVEAQKVLRRNGTLAKSRQQLGIFEEDNLLKCKGRMEHSELEIGACTPILLPRNHHFTKLIVENVHRRVGHNGVRSTLTELRTRFWIIKGRQYVKKVIGKCVVCKRQEGKPYQAPLTAPLPEFRVNEAPPFSNCGLDFAGPLYYKDKQGIMQKSYFALFTCCLTRAVHLELVEDLSAPTFIRCLHRFTARRGAPTLFISDNARTFKATDKFLYRMSQDRLVKDFTDTHMIEWRFNLDRSPWQGGLFVRLIGCTKRCLRKVIGNARLSYDELSTVLVEVEGILNARPLTYIYDEIGEEPLTPDHLLHGRLLTSISHRISCYEDEDDDKLTKRFIYLQKKLTHFWKRWRKEYLTELRERHKITGKDANVIQVGDIVLVKEENTKRGLWKLAKVEQLLHGKDGQVRGAKIRENTKGKPVFINRPIQLLYPLELRSVNENEKEVPKVNVEERPQRAAARNSMLRTRLMLDSI